MASVLQLRKKIIERPTAPEAAGIQIRHFADDADIAAWIDLRDQAFARERVGVRRWTAGDFAAELTGRWWWRPESMWLAEANTPSGAQLVGSIVMAMRGGPDNARPAVHWLIVRPAWRRRGIGRLLMAHLEVAAWDDGHREIYLETHASWKAAAAFYETLGYLP
jgi:GNAT superfamily N-acetyltransferase